MDPVRHSAVHVGLDALALGPRPAGIGRYVRTLLIGLGDIAWPGLEVTVWARPGAEADLADALPRAGARLASPGRVWSQPPWRLLWEQVGLPRAARARSVNLVHGLMGVIPLATSLPRVVTIHDATFVSHPELHQRAKVAYFGALLARAARAARVVLTDSVASRNALIEHLGARPERVRVVPLAIDPAFVPAAPEAIAEARCRFGLEQPFVLYAGVLEPRKNLPRLIEAVLLLRRRGLPHRLAIVGKEGWGLGPTRAALARAGDAVRVLGYVSDPDLNALFAAADAFAYVPLVEGFGLPVAEAMAAGAAVVTSSDSSLPEVAGGAARLVDPRRSEAIAEGLEELLRSPERRAELRRLGRERARALTPAALARATAEAWHAALEG